MLNLLFPKICNGCNNPLLGSEKILCITCRHILPLTNYHLNANGAMKKMFYGKIPVIDATALFSFQKNSITQEILHNLKYRKQEEISGFFGQWLGEELKISEGFKNIDCVIAVPLHPSKKRSRGYNQVDGFAREIASALSIAYLENVLVKTKKAASQVFKERVKRFSGTEEQHLFTVENRSLLQDKHILLVDDVVTTGATLENCALTLLEGTNASISLATIAIADS